MCFNLIGDLIEELCNLPKSLIRDNRFVQAARVYLVVVERK